MDSSDDATMLQRAPVRQEQIVPDLLKVSPMETSTATDVETSITEPVVISDNFCRFVLLNKGILHSHSKVTLALTAPDASSRFFPPNVGVASLIERCALKVGTKTLQEIDGYNFLTAYKSMFINNEHQLERELVQSGRSIAHEFIYSNDTSTLAGGAANDTLAPTYGLSTGKEYKEVNGSSNVVLPQFADIKNSPVFQIALSDLFPMLKQTQLPLYMMKEQVSIELTFAPSAVRAQSASGVGTASYLIDTNEVKFIADYIYYPQQMMDAYAQANQQITINHFDYRHSKFSVSATTAASTQIRNLGGAGRIVTKVITGVQANATNDLSIMNQFHAMCPETSMRFGQLPGALPDQENGSITYNIKYNDRFLYPIDVSNSARHFHNVAQAEGVPPFVTREEYSAQGVALTGEKFMGYVQFAGNVASQAGGMGIGGRFAWLSNRLNRNERVNSRGVEVYFKYDTLDNGGAFTQRSWVELVKLTQLTGGYITTQLA
tara:strand:+ start:244 stop:1716 length:1473 start_codon:yes stop_codon:yes gene_type:complete